MKVFMTVLFLAVELPKAEAEKLKLLSKKWLEGKPLRL